MLHNMMNLVVIMRRLAALTVSCLSALVADGRPTQTACGAIDPNGRRAVRRRAGPSTPTADPLWVGLTPPGASVVVSKSFLKIMKK